MTFREFHNLQDLSQLREGCNFSRGHYLGKVRDYLPIPCPGNFGTRLG